MQSVSLHYHRDQNFLSSYPRLQRFERCKLRNRNNIEITGTFFYAMHQKHRRELQVSARFRGERLVFEIAQFEAVPDLCGAELGVLLQGMEAAAQRFLGEHDFRNFCKPTPDVANYVRKVTRVELGLLRPHAGDRARDLMQLTVRGSAFLYHQIRCMVSVLLLIGYGREEPEVRFEAAVQERGRNMNFVRQ